MKIETQHKPTCPYCHFVFRGEQGLKDHLAVGCSDKSQRGKR